MPGCNLELGLEESEKGGSEESEKAGLEEMQGGGVQRAPYTCLVELPACDTGNGGQGRRDLDLQNRPKFPVAR